MALSGSLCHNLSQAPLPQIGKTGMHVSINSATLTMPLTYIAVQTLASNPVHSRTTFASWPSAAFTSSAASLGSLLASICTVRTRGTSFLASCSLSLLISVMAIGLAPAAAAASSETMPIGPAPQITSGSPSRTLARSTPANATESGSSNAPSSKVIGSGNL